MLKVLRKEWVVLLYLLCAVPVGAATDLEKAIEQERHLLSEEDVEAIRALDPQSSERWGEDKFRRDIEHLSSLQVASRSAFRALLWHVSVGDPSKSIEAFDLISKWINRFPELREELVVNHIIGYSRLDQARFGILTAIKEVAPFYVELKMARRLAEIALSPYPLTAGDDSKRAATVLARSWLVTDDQMPQSPAVKAAVLLGHWYESSTCSEIVLGNQ